MVKLMSYIETVRVEREHYYSLHTRVTTKFSLQNHAHKVTNGICYTRLLLYITTACSCDASFTFWKS
jgi:hypothetical protein